MSQKEVHWNHEHKWTCDIIIDRQNIAVGSNVNKKRVVNNYDIY